jgi:hypothetical protein
MIKTLVTFGLLAAPFVASASEVPETIELVHEVRLAFYMKAPPGIAKPMRAVIRTECAARRHGKAAQANSEWLCDGSPLYFLSAVDVLGNQTKKGGFACDDGVRASGIKYWLMDMINFEDDCVFVDCKDGTLFVVSRVFDEGDSKDSESKDGESN